MILLTKLVDYEAQIYGKNVSLVLYCLHLNACESCRDNSLQAIDYAGVDFV